MNTKKQPAIYSALNLTFKLFLSWQQLHSQIEKVKKMFYYCLQMYCKKELSCLP
ncbi:conserved protein of unknown function [Kingella kingae]|uniref:Uncharacterized protein n=1 Tax=Kingella kingae ATCC 23330 TaxID=887327 RepID=F5S4F9_KINKI|nr:hypothetical protein HMPREF0476_0092 [Kingella kingae ATCC 23330]CRZ19718.1 conserved protein of unknown function [Kingella kingae]